MSAKEKRRRRWPFVLGLVVGFVVLGGTVALRLFFHGAPLARLVAGQLNGRIQGSVEISSIEWSLADLPSVLVGGPLELKIHGATVYAPPEIEGQRGTVVIDAPLVTATLDTGAAMFGKHDLLLSDISIDKGYARVEQIHRPSRKNPSDGDTVSLVAAFAPKPRPRFVAGVVPHVGGVIDLANYKVQNIDMDFVYPAFSARANGAWIDDEGSLTFDAHDPLAGRLFYELAPKAKTSTVTINTGSEPIVLEIQDLNVTRLRQLPLGWPDETIARAFEYKATARTAEGAELVVDGKMIQALTDPFGGSQDIRVDLAKAGPLAHRLLPPLGGDALALTYTLKGSGMALDHHVDLTGLALEVPGARAEPLAVEVGKLSVSYQGASGRAKLDNVDASVAGGKLTASAGFDGATRTAEADVEIVEPIDLGSYLPREVVRAVGGSRLRGRFHGKGDLEAQRVDSIDLTLGTAHVSGAVVRKRDGVISPKGLRVAIGGTAARDIKGTFDSASGALDLDLYLDSSDVARWLRAFRKPVVATSLRGPVQIGGTVAAPTVGANLTAGGVPVVDRVTTDVDYRGNAVTIRSLEAGLLGGWLRASGKVLLGGRPRLAGVSAEGGELDLAKLPGGGKLVRGVVAFDADADGSLKAPKGSAVATVKGLAIAGDAYADTRVQVTAGVGEPVRLTGALEREAGGALAIDASYDPRGGQLGGEVELRALPLDAMTALAGIPSVVGGTLDAVLRLSGTDRAPTADGTISIKRGWFEQAFVGNADLSIERIGDGQIRLAATLFQERVAITAELGTRAPYAASVVVKLKRVELDLFAPELATRYGVRGWLTGELSFRGDLGDLRPGRLQLGATFSEIVVVLDGDDGAGPGRLRIENRTPVELAFDGERLRLVNDIVLRGPTGDFTLSGSATRTALALKARGKVSVGLLTPYVRQYFDRVSGELAIELGLTGSLAKPRMTGVIDIHDVAMQPTGQDTMVRVPAGKIEVDGEQVSLTGLSMVVTDEFSKDQSVLRIAGGVRLAGFRPSVWAVQIDGELDGKMLLVVAPQAFSAGFGSAELSIALQGKGEMPDINGTVEFSAETPLTIVPRGVRREIALTGGSIGFTDQLISIGGETGPITGVIDDEGIIERLEGEIGLEKWKPVDVDIEIDASSLALRIPGTLDLTVNLRKLYIVGDGGGLEVGGTLEIPDGRYIKKFNIVSDVLQPQRALTPSRPFWESSPLLARAALKLTVISQAFYVKNNIATIAMSGQVMITGTPVDPRLGGVIHVDDGEFKFQGIRPRFERAGGEISFEPLQRFPAGTPTLALHAEADYQDSSGQSHLIHLALNGTLSNLNWDLRTESGLDRAQTLQLVLAGRTPEEVRAALGDTAIGKPGATPDSGSEGNSGFVYADQFVKDLSGDFFSLLLGDTLQNVTNLDVIRLQVGTSAFGAHAEEHVTPNFHVLGDVESSLRGWNWDVTGEYRFTDSVSLDGSLRRRYFDDQALEDIKKLSGQLTWRRVLLP